MTTVVRVLAVLGCALNLAVLAYIKAVADKRGPEFKYGWTAAILCMSVVTLQVLITLTY